MAKANEEGKLFGSVTSAHIAEALAKEGYPVESEKVKLDTPIKICGEYKVTVALNPELQTTCKVLVVREEEQPAQA
jgi:large subunit ribosomal protein L9